MAERVQAAPTAVLSTAGADVVVVGSTALALHASSCPSPTWIVAPDCSWDGLTGLRAALDSLVPIRGVPAVLTLASLDIATIATSFGPVDLLLGRGCGA